MDIPKVIHYCWFGGKNKPMLVNDCIQSWKTKLPDYEIIEWNESNADLSSSFVQFYYHKKKWAFVADYVRLSVLYEFGGIYLDTDMFVVKSFNSLLNTNLFFGSEEKRYISGGIVGVIKNHPFIEKCVLYYNSITLSDGDLRSRTIPKIITSLYRENYDYRDTFAEILEINDSIIYPDVYFYPFPLDAAEKHENFYNYIKPETFAVHLWNMSWIERSEFFYLKKGLYLQGIFKVLSNAIKGKKKVDTAYLKMLAYSVKKSFKRS